MYWVSRSTRPSKPFQPNGEYAVDVFFYYCRNDRIVNNSVGICCIYTRMVKVYLGMKSKISEEYLLPRICLGFLYVSGFLWFWNHKRSSDIQTYLQDIENYGIIRDSRFREKMECERIFSPFSFEYDHLPRILPKFYWIVIGHLVVHLLFDCWSCYAGDALLVTCRTVLWSAREYTSSTQGETYRTSVSPHIFLSQGSTVF